MLIIRSGEEIDRSMFDVKVAKLIEASGQDQKYGIGPVGSYGAKGGSVCNPNQNIFNLMSYLTFFIIVIFFPHI